MSKVICKNLRGEEFETDSEALSFRPAVYGLLIEDNKILLSPQWDGYCFPGGAIELGETTEESLRREYKEETGLNVEPTALIEVKDSFFQTVYSRRNVHSLLIFYLCKRVGGELSIADLEEKEKPDVSFPVWIDLKDIDHIRFMSTVNCLDVVDKALKITSKIVIRKG